MKSEGLVKIFGQVNGRSLSPKLLANHSLVSVSLFVELIEKHENIFIIPTATVGNNSKQANVVGQQKVSHVPVCFWELFHSQSEKDKCWITQQTASSYESNL